MLAMRRLWTVLVGASLGAFLARAILDWLLGLEGTWVAAAILVAAAFGGYLSIGEARNVKPMDPSERRDTILGWGALSGGVAAVAWLLAPMPWGAFAAVAVLAATVLALAKCPGPAGRTRA